MIENFVGNEENAGYQYLLLFDIFKSLLSQVLQNSGLSG